MHSSLSSMGYVEGGADTVIDAFLHVLRSLAKIKWIFSHSLGVSW